MVLANSARLHEGTNRVANLQLHAAGHLHDASRSSNNANHTESVQASTKAASDMGFDYHCLEPVEKARFGMWSQERKDAEKARQERKDAESQCQGCWGLALAMIEAKRPKCDGSSETPLFNKFLESATCSPPCTRKYFDFCKEVVNGTRQGPGYCAAALLKGYQGGAPGQMAIDLMIESVGEAQALTGLNALCSKSVTATMGTEVNCNCQAPWPKLERAVGGDANWAIGISMMSMRKCPRCTFDKDQDRCVGTVSEGHECERVTSAEGKVTCEYTGSKCCKR